MDYRTLFIFDVVSLALLCGRDLNDCLALPQDDRTEMVFGVGAAAACDDDAADDAGRLAGRHHRAAADDPGQPELLRNVHGLPLDTDPEAACVRWWGR